MHPGKACRGGRSHRRTPTGVEEFPCSPPGLAIAGPARCRPRESPFTASPMMLTHEAEPGSTRSLIRRSALIALIDDLVIRFYDVVSLARRRTRGLAMSRLTSRRRRRRLVLLLRVERATSFLERG